MSLAKKFKVYAVILNYNSGPETVRLYNELLNCSYKNLKVIVIDNGSKDNSSNLLRETIPEEDLVLNKRNLGYAAGNNLGIARALESKADYVWVLNPDIKVQEDSLAILVETMQNDKSLAAVGPRILHRNDPARIFSDGEKMFMNKNAATLHKNHNLVAFQVPRIIDYDVDYIAGSSILLNIEAVRDSGRLPEEYFLYFEETDWCFKARRHNWKLAVNRNSEVFNLTSPKGAVFHYYFIRNKLIFSKKYHPDFIEVRKYYLNELKHQIISRLSGKYFPPYFTSHVKGLISGLIKTAI